MIKAALGRSSGQTMIDLMIALALLALAVASSATLANSSFRAGQESGRRSQAVALGQRELEGMRALRDTLAAATAPPNDLWSYVTVPAKGQAKVVNGANCKQVYMVRRNTTSGWDSLPPPAVEQPQIYAAGDEVNSSGNPDTTFGNDASGFARLIQFCQAQDYTAGRYVPSNNIYNVEIRVFWKEANGPTVATSGGQTFNRSVILHTVLSTPKG